MSYKKSRLSIAAAITLAYAGTCAALPPPGYDIHSAKLAAATAGTAATTAGTTAAAPAAAPAVVTAATPVAASLAASTTAAGATTPPSTHIPVDTLPRYAAPHVNFVVVVVSDFARGLAFYEQVLGMHERGRAQPDLRNFEVIVGFDDNPLSGGISVKYRGGVVEPKGNGSSAINLVVRDLAGIVGRVAAGGGTVVLPLARHDSAAMSYSFAIVKDPDGNVIELVEYHKGAK